MLPSPRPEPGGAPAERPVGVLVAVREELAAVCARLRPLAVGRRPDGLFGGDLGGRSVVVARSGMGSERAAVVARHLIEGACPSALIIAGFAAGLSDRCRAGDVVIATEVLGADAHEAGHTASPLLPDASLLAAAQAAAAAKAGHHSGRLITAGAVQLTPAAKRDMAGGRRGAIALDMETAGAAAVARDHGVPWLAIRALTDAVDDAMPVDFARHVDHRTGEVKRSILVRLALTSPWRVPGLLALGKRAALAAGNLGEFIELVVQAVGADRAGGGV